MAVRPLSFTWRKRGTVFIPDLTFLADALMPCMRDYSEHLGAIIRGFLECGAGDPNCAALYNKLLSEAAVVFVACLYR